VIPLVLAAAGVAAIVAAGLILRTFGPRYRIARLLATTPTVTVGEANRMANEGDGRYVGVRGRIDAADEFEGPDHQPLVYRRVRLELRSGSGWRPFEDHRQVVAFTVNEGLDAIGVDTDALAEGLVVVQRESVGVAADLLDRVPAGTRPDAPVRARIEQVSSVEHAIVLGVPVATGAAAGPDAPAGADAPIDPHAPTARMTAGRSRPLVMTILETDEAMRVLAADGRGRTRAAALLLGAAAVLLGGATIWAIASALLPAVIALAPGLDGLVATAFAASPEPSAEVVGDPRSNGQGPGLVGTPGLAILGVAAIAVLAIIVTTVYVRLTAPPEARDRRR
jgi:hypothetical protein